METVITVVICLLIGLFGDIMAHNGQNVTNAVQASARASSTPALRNNSEHSNIDKTLLLVAENWNKIDVNKDGKHNCIDAAVLFYQYYPDKSKVCIELNKNPDTGMNHLFNCVFTDGVWKAIEPQAYASNKPSYLMGAIWGKNYDASYNRDVTSDYMIYVKR